MNHKFNILMNDYTVCPDTWGMTDEIAPFYRMYYVKGGEAYLRKNGRDIRLQKDHFYIFPVMRPYTLWQNSGDPLEVLWFHVEMQMDFRADFEEIKIEEDSLMGSLLRSMRYMTQSAGLFEELTRVFDVFLTVLGEALPLRAVSGRKMQEVLDFIGENIGGELSVAMLADHAGMDRSYFSRKFKAAFHMPPLQYIFAERMSAAAKALAGGATVGEASAAAGYGDEKAFARAFKRYMEITPSQYKKSHIMQP